MDYSKYEQLETENREKNEKILKKFLAWLRASRLVDKTINKHYGNVEFYINEYLTYDEIITPEEGIYDINMFFRDWAIRKNIISSEYGLKDYITSLKKFYTYLCESNEISIKDYEIMKEMIKENKEDWIHAIQSEYEDEYLD